MKEVSPHRSFLPSVNNSQIPLARKIYCFLQVKENQTTSNWDGVAPYTTRPDIYDPEGLFCTIAELNVIRDAKFGYRIVIPRIADVSGGSNEVFQLYYL